MKEMHEMNKTILSILKKRRKDQNKQGVITYYVTTTVLVTEVG